MASPTYTEAGLQTELNAFITSLEGEDYATARVKLIRYQSVWQIIRPDVGGDGLSVKFPDPDALRRTLDAAQAAIQRGGDDSRLIRTRLRHA